MHNIVNCPAAHSGKNKALCQVPLYGGVPRSGGVVRKCKNVLHPYSPLSSWGAGSPPHTPVILGLDPRIQVMRDFITTGSPRSQCSLAMTKSTVPSSPLWRGAAQRQGGQRIQECTTSLFPLVILGRRVPTTHTCHPGA